MVVKIRFRKYEQKRNTRRRFVIKYGGSEKANALKTVVSNIWKFVNVPENWV